MKYQRNIYVLSIIVLLYLVLVYSSGDAKVTGNCANCHIMHNSQNGTAMATYGATGQLWKGTGPYSALTRGECLGCHGMGTADKIVTIGGSDIPQVYHTDGSGDLAGGNFAYITGAKSRVTADGNSAGHNVIVLGQNETVLQYAPGLYPLSGHDMIITNTKLTCAGDIGCHGNRSSTFGTGIRALKGAHHQNVDGKCDTANTIANSYRFLSGVKGLENTGTYKWQNYNDSNHNEYFGATPPKTFSTCGTSDCHGSNGVYSSNGSISVFCGTCHGDFHRIGGIGGDTVSPFTRHPTDVTLPNIGEYSAYTTYSVVAPVARQTVFDFISSTVTPGTDVVMCLSCHAAHATPYADLLKWDYSAMVAGGGGSGGCFTCTCHTQKSQTP
jgi:hypothetical protein